MSVTVTPAASHNKGQNGALRILKTLCFTYSTVLLTWVTSHALVFPQNINANYKPLVCPCPSSRNHHSGVETPILNSEMQSLWLGADVTLFPWCCAREDTSTSRFHCVRGPGAVRSRAPLGGAPGGPAASAPGVPPMSGSPGMGSPVRCHGLQGPLATTTAWLSWRARPFRGATALPGCADIPQEAPGRAWASAAVARQQHGLAPPRLLARFQHRPSRPPSLPPLRPQLPLWLRSGGSCGRRLGCRRLSALSNPSCHRGGGLQGRLRGCRAGPSPAARTTRGPWLRRRGGGGAGVSWASRRRRAGGWLASCATSCMGTPEQSPRS